MKLSIITATYHRAKMLASRALPSVMAQTCHDFEWVVINDGGDEATRALIESLDLPFPLVYRDMPHPAQGFGLCHGRNLGLEVARGERIAYLDDDNALEPEFVAVMTQLFEAQPSFSLCCCFPQQRRRRDVVKEGNIVREGKPFISPSDCCEPTALIQQRELFDSNGFTHVRSGCPQWNPAYRVFADYEYFLQSLSLWGKNSFQVYSPALVNYVQTSDGVIGQSSYAEWAHELVSLAEQSESYSILEPADRQRLLEMQQVYHLKHQQGRVIESFI
jgi:glycosyltransferase involved in cell wall biosynthesis